jgi:hypothetical protein
MIDFKTSGLALPETIQIFRSSDILVQKPKPDHKNFNVSFKRGNPRTFKINYFSFDLII